MSMGSDHSIGFSSGITSVSLNGTNSEIVFISEGLYLRICNLICSLSILTSDRFSTSIINIIKPLGDNLYDKVRELKTEKDQKTKNKKTDKYKEMFLKYIDDDLNIPRALALTWDLIKDKNVSSKDKYKLLLSFDQVFGLNLKEVKEIKIPQEIKELTKQREQFRKANNWKEADLIRKEIEKLGFQVEDAEGKNLIKKINR